MNQIDYLVKLLVTMLLSLCLIGISISAAEAARFGGRVTMGKMSRITPIKTPIHKTTAPSSNKSSPKNFFGPMTGLLAGGLLASLLFGGGFEHLRFMDIILIVIVIAFIVMLLRRHMANIAQKQSYAGQTNLKNNPVAKAINTDSSESTSAATTLPNWFDETAFLQGASQHFYTLQKAWDHNDFQLIQDYVTPELYNLLRHERSQSPENNQTEILKLDSKILSINDNNEYAEVNLLFYGTLRENGVAQPFQESWHLVRQMRINEPWYIQGIEQYK